MSLIAFHRFLIGAGIVFCLGYSGWQVMEYAESGAGADLALAAVFLVLGALLGAYLWQLSRFLGYGGRGPGDGRTG